MALEAAAWEELCRRSVPFLHRCDLPLAKLGPWEGAQRYWQGNNPEFDVVARSVDSRRLLVGEVKWSEAPYAISQAQARPGVETLPSAASAEVVRVLFVPQAAAPMDSNTGVHIVDAKAVIAVLR